jgi:hypothetical protein
MTLTPRTRPILRGFLIHANPTADVIESVRTAETAEAGSNQQQATDVAAHATTAQTVCKPHKYSPADEKSMRISSEDENRSSEVGIQSSSIVVVEWLWWYCLLCLAIDTM